MPSTITIDGWKDATHSIPFFTQSTQLKTLTKSFESYARRESQANLEHLASDFHNWRTMPTVLLQNERTKLQAPSEDLEYTIVRAKHTNRVIKAKASGVKAQGWGLVGWTKAAYSWTSAVPHPDTQGPLSPSQIMRVNEAFRRAKHAVEQARNEVIFIAKKAALTRPVTAREQLFVDYFGAFDQARAKTVLENYNVLCLAFEDTPNVVDLRNTLYGKTCYAACFRNDLRSRDAKTKALSLTGKVDIFMGRGFFDGTSSYAKSTDATVGTLIHEFAHGAINAVDAPRVYSNGNWELQPQHLGDPGHPDYGSSPVNSKQSSTPTLDKRLAGKEPTIALRNADTYGQFARLLLQEKGK